MARDKSANSPPKQQNSSPDSASTKAPELKDGVFHRMKRKGNGWVLEKLTLMQGKVLIEEVGDWDIRAVVEQKAISAIARHSAD